MSSAEDFLAEVQSAAPGCPEPVILTRIAEAAREFCEKAPVWTEELPLIDVVATTHTYVLTPTVTNAKVHDILVVEYDGRGIGPTTEQELADFLPRWRSLSGGIIAYLAPARGSVRLVRTPDTDLASGLFVEVSVKPGRNSTGDNQLPNVLFDDWYDAIVSGAISRVCSMPGRTWTNPGLADVHGRQFDDKVADARVAYAKGNTRADMGVRMRRFV